MIAQFALRLMFGISLMWCVMPRREVSVGFFRIQMLVVMGFGVLSALTFEQFPRAAESVSLLDASWGQVLTLAICVLAFFGSAVWTLGSRKLGTGIVFAICLLSGAVLLGSTARLGVPQRDWLLIAAEISTSASLGGAMTGMLLGHWYLTAPTMSIQPLTSLNRAFGIAVLLRLIVSIIVLVLAAGLLQESTHLLWFSLRWLAGLIGPLVLVVMVSKILGYKNTQSATGVLFVGVILTFIGELSATLLTQELQMPF